MAQRLAKENQKRAEEEEVSFIKILIISMPFSIFDIITALFRTKFIN